MKFKFIWKEYTVVKHGWERYEVKENKTLTIDCDEKFSQYLCKNKFIIVKMEDETSNESKKETKKEEKARLAEEKKVAEAEAELDATEETEIEEETETEIK